LTDGSLQVDGWNDFDGRDVLGSYSGVNVDWTPVDLKTSFRVYDDSKIIVFKQQFFNLEVRLNI
jgi:hypothetical protein